MNKCYLLALIIGCTFMLGCTSKLMDAPGDTPAPAVKLPVDVKVVRATKYVHEEQVAGSLVANQEVTLVSEFTERVVSMHFKEGSTVTKDQLLYRLDDSEITAELKRLQAEVALAKLTESRLARLLEGEAVRQEEYDIALSKLKALSASEELLRLELDKTWIRAPFSGVIGITRVHPGQLVNAGQALVDLKDYSVIKVQFAIAEKYLPALRKGKTISFLAGDSPLKQTAKISAWDAGLHTETRTVLVHASATNYHHLFTSGMSARVFFSPSDEQPTAIMLPTESLMPGTGDTVFTR